MNGRCDRKLTFGAGITNDGFVPMFAVPNAAERDERTVSFGVDDERGTTEISALYCRTALPMNDWFWESRPRPDQVQVGDARDIQIRPGRDRPETRKGEGKNVNRSVLNAHSRNRRRSASPADPSPLSAPSLRVR